MFGNLRKDELRLVADKMAFLCERGEANHQLEIGGRPCPSMVKSWDIHMFLNTIKNQIPKTNLQNRRLSKDLLAFGPARLIAVCN
ncbi:hypothetical protein HNY73_010168 [Argiope bruennichi]|uniref:Uncharacterized protein n=1 Tax=Argiope bruennichi TaxID=94029 RepID=A0A8T0F515_ARGBR|nr:hypothetical protein HNY73_010168 [Argiope bruennichi]